MSLEINTYTVLQVINISFVMAVSKFISVDKMKELVIVKDLSYSDVGNMLQERNPDVKGVSEASVRHFRTSNNIRKQSNLSKEEFQKIIFFEASKVCHLNHLLFMQIIVFRNVLKRITQVNQLFALYYYHYENIHYLDNSPLPPLK